MSPAVSDEPPPRVDRSRSPLTAQQESELLSEPSGVGIVFGTQASGLSDVGNSLVDAFSDHHLDLIEEATDLDGFLNTVRGQIESKRDGLNIAVVSHRVDWSAEWTYQASKAAEHVEIEALHF